MVRIDPDRKSSLPGFRHVLEAALLFGSAGGLADISYIISRAPDIDSEFLQGLRFCHAGIFLTAIAFLLLLLISLLIVRPVAARRKWPLELSLAVLYFIAALPVALLVFRSFAVMVAKESVLVSQVKSLFYFLKYLWLLIPVSWAVGAWLARVRTSVSFATLAGRISACVVSAAVYLVLTPVLQQRLLLEKANEYSQVAGSGSENTVITLGVFIGSFAVFGLGWWLFVLLAKRARGIWLALFWIAFIVIPFLPPVISGSLTKGTPPSGNSVSGQKSNVILISLDTVRYDDVGPFGSKVAKTPTLDSIASRGTCFDKAIVPMPLTGPSHISMFTGLQPDSEIGHGVKTNGIPLSKDIPTLASILNNSGYSTGAIIGGFPLARNASGLDRGFNYYNDVFNEGLRARFLPDQVWYLTVSKVLKKSVNVAPFLPHGRTKPADKVTDQAIGWLAKNSDKPFFLFMHYYDAHYLYAPPPPFDSMYMPGYTGPYKNKAVEWNELMKSIDTFTKDDFDYFRAMYRGEISFVDQELGRLISWGNENRVWDNTLLIVVSDHGESFEHNYYFNHPDRVYDSLVHVPLIIKEPESVESPRGARCGTLICASDIFYTVLDFLKIAPPRTVEAMNDGVIGPKTGWDHNLLELIHSPDSTAFGNESGISKYTDVGWEYVPSQSYSFAGPDELNLGRFFSFRFSDWKLIYGPQAPPKLPEFQCFDLRQDPDELNDLFSQVDWRNRPDLIVPDGLKEWASKQGEIDISGLDPRMRAELKALGYIQEQ